MLIRRGIAVSPGVVTGPALVLGTENFRIPNHFVRVDAVETEVGRFHAALDAVCRELSENASLAAAQLGSQYGQIFTAHLEMARDPGLTAEIEKLIRKKCYSPEFAASYVLGRRAKVLENLDNQFLRERAADVFDVKKRILAHLLGERREELVNLTTPVVVLANNLTPGETARLNKDNNRFVLGFATEVGGPTSHTSIIAGALEIPAVVGVGHFLSDVSGGETVIIDGNHGEVIIDPDEETRARYLDNQQRFRSVTERLEALGTAAPVTQDGVRIQVLGNIEFPDEVEHCTQRGADGIGLYRTEFLFLETGHEPSEDDHYRAYRRVISAFPDKPVVIRTLDLGADKVLGEYGLPARNGLNPMLGLRSIRMSLQNLPLFKTQLRAILRAAVDGDVRIMFPLISSLTELRHARMVLHDVMEDLEEIGIPFEKDVPVGMMVEVPSAVILADEFAREVDFFSIGTNDLIQYTLAVDRSDPAVASLYSSGDPSIVRLIRHVVEAGARHQVPVTVCGQMSSEPMYLPLLVGLGLRQLSVTPHALPELKEVIRNITVGHAEAIAAHVATLEVARDVESYLRGELKKLCPDLVL